MTANRFFTVRERCPACKSARLAQLYECPFTEPPVRTYLEDFYLPQGKLELEFLEGESYDLMLCGVCDLVFQRSIPNPDLMHIIYESWIDPDIAYATRITQSTLERPSIYAQEIMQLIGWFGRVPSSLRLLDFGMGWGMWALMAKALGCEALGVEISRRRADHARSCGIRVIDWTDIPGLGCDFINTEQVFEHLAEPLSTIRHLQSGLRPGGVLKISVPKGTDVLRRLKRMDWAAPKGNRHSLNPVAPLEHINCYGKRSIRTLAESAGLKVTSVPLRHQYQYMPNWSRPRAIARNVALPLMRTWQRGQTYSLLKKAD